MKKSIILSLAILFATSTFAQVEKNEKYIGAMKINIELIDMAFSKPEATNAFIELANNFERIANKEKSEWLPYYYAAYCRVNYGFMQNDKTGNDAIADYAAKLINKADSLQPNNSEISCLKSMIASLQMMVNPQARWMQYGPISQKAMDAAIQQDPTNPRPHMLKGQGLKYTPEAFGGGCKTALAHLKTSVEKYNTFKPASDIAPNWGKSYTEVMLKECEATK
jgi:hypothetical protein